MPAETRIRALRKRRRKDSLLRFARNVRSQSGEDGIIAAIFEALDSEKKKTASEQRRWCVDVGAWDGVHLSNTYALLVESREEWRGVLIEADEERFKQLEALHQPLGNVSVKSTVSCEPDNEQSLSRILKKHIVDKEIDLVSIDVDGPDYWLFKDLLENYSPKVVVCEFNPTVPHDVVFVQDRDDKIRHGSSLAALDDLANKFGYSLAETTTYNAFFLRKDCHQLLVTKGLCHPEDDLDDLHDFTMGTNLYQLYDGTLKLSGCKKLLWHKKPLEENKIQHLAPSDRVYPYAPNSQNSGGEPSPTDAPNAEVGTQKTKNRRNRRSRHKKNRSNKKVRDAKTITRNASLTLVCICVVAAILLRRRR